MDPTQEQSIPQQESPVVPQQLEQPPVARSGVKGVIVLFVIAVFLVGIGAYLLGNYVGKSRKANSSVGQETTVQPFAKNLQVSQIPQEITVASTPAIPHDWKTFTSTSHQFRVQYSPLTYLQEVTTPYYYIVVYPNPNTVAAGVRAMPIFVISALADTFNTANVPAYDFTSNDWITSLSQLAVGQSTTIGSGIVFTRQTDALVYGQAALHVLVVAKGFRQQRVYIKKNGYWYSIADYYAIDPDPNQFTLFLSSFKFTQ